eukprot:CAMPEP_0118655716 /NCGR_PEP_ID=MMETSP0785-20121206/13090_1 /TAXON_ID=91992 /ORGANISM="Bolidomonas pacifica, Strain CCMP 1866" /LENGTH=525 /DNA_ID=CAMNT_0006548499 /DNA_START=101 /DNA_END=1675 /DNA_ORIENTATION=+
MANPNSNNAHASIGLQGMWGFSPSVDLLEESQHSIDGDEINVLLVNACDIRHVLKTISRRRRSSSPNTPPPAVNFYMIDNPVEVTARHLLLLSTIFDWEIPIRQRSILFLEIYGNCLIQDRTSRYIAKQASGLIELVTGGEHQLEDMVCFDHLKFRERDGLESCFKHWGDSSFFDMAALRDQRLRHYYGERYDSRRNVLDWDYQTRIKLVASIIHIKQYREWRNSGIAFEFGDSTYNQPNKTMSSYAIGTLKKGKEKGIKKEIRGFWLDVVVSPYSAFGVECERVNEYAEGLFQILNKGTGTEQHRHHTVEVATYNIMSYLWEIETNKKYEMRKKNDIFSGLGEDASDVIIYSNGKEEEEGDTEAQAESTTDGNADTSSKPPEPPKSNVQPPAAPQTLSEAEKEERIEKRRIRQAASRARNIVEAMDNVKVYPLCGTIDSMYNKSKFTNKFDIVHVSQHGVHNIGDENFASLLAANASVMLESGKHVYALSNKQCTELTKKMVELTEKHPTWKLKNSNKAQIEKL